MIFKFLFIHMCMCPCGCMPFVRPEGQGQIPCSWKYSKWCWEPNSALLREHQMLITTGRLYTPMRHLQGTSHIEACSSHSPRPFMSVLQTALLLLSCFIYRSIILCLCIKSSNHLKELKLFVFHKFT